MAYNKYLDGGMTHHEFLSWHTDWEADCAAAKEQKDIENAKFQEEWSKIKPAYVPTMGNPIVEEDYDQDDHSED